MNKKELLNALEGVADNAAIVVVQSAGEGHYNCSPVEGVQYNQATSSVYKENSPEPHVIYRLSASHFCIVPKLLPPAPTIKV